MNDEARKLRNAYAREWRSKNKDKVKAHQEKYWKNKAKKLKEEGLDPELKEMIDSFFHNETLEEREEKVVNKIIDVLEDGEIPIYRVPAIMENVEKRIYSAVVKLASIRQ